MRGVWGWSPGTRVERAIYAPALVAFIGSPGGDSVAWFPLGPGDPYVPPYQVSPSYVRAINVTSVRAANVGTAHVNYVNQSVPGAATSVPRGTFVSAHPVIAAARPLSVDAVRQARVVGTAPPITPSPESIVVKSQGRVAAPPAAVAQRRVVARTPPPPMPVPFAARESAMKDHPGRPVDPGTLGSVRAQTQSTVTTPPVRVVTPQGAAVARTRPEPGPTVPAVGQPPRANEPPPANQAPRANQPPTRRRGALGRHRERASPPSVKRSPG